MTIMTQKILVMQTDIVGICIIFANYELESNFNQLHRFQGIVCSMITRDADSFKRPDSIHLTLFTVTIHVEILLIPECVILVWPSPPPPNGGIPDWAKQSQILKGQK